VGFIPVRWSGWFAGSRRNEWILVRMPDRVEGEINVEFGPVEVLGVGAFYMKDRRDASGAEPWELVEREDELLVVGEQPDAMG
jgi:hypothetical protein